MGDNKIYHGDCLELMKDIPDGSVDMTITSPPYDNLRTYNGSLDWGEHVWKPVIEHLFRVAKQGGVVVWVVGDATINGSETGTSFKQALYFKECGFNLHDTMIYRKTNKQPLNHPRYEQEFEYMFVFSKSRPDTVNLIHTRCLHAGKTNTGTARNGGSETLQQKHGAGKPCKDTKPLGNIWSYVVGVETYNNGTHPAIFPLQLATDHILSWSNEGDTVLDCFAGSGTTGVACLNTNRRYILIEKEQKYYDICIRRCAEASLNLLTTNEMAV